MCDTLFVEQASAVAKSRPVYDQLIETFQENDTLVVWDLDRAFRSTIDAVREAERLRTRGIHFQIVSLDVDTTTADGLLMYTVVAAIGQHERMRISERTKEGLAAARRRGQRLGRPPKLSAAEIEAARARLAKDPVTLKSLAAELGMAPWSLSRALKRQGPRRANVQSPS
ncbi:MAG: recombinase family protein [Pseudomonadota bacterium]